MNIARFSRENSRAVYLLTALLLAAGLVSAFRLPSNIYPPLTFPRIVILAHSGDLAPQVMLLSVTRPLEEAGRSVLGARRVRSRTIRGAAEISVFFNPDMDMQYALQLAQAKVSEARGELPAGTDVSVERVTPASWPILMMVVRGDVPSADLRDYAYYNLRPIFSRVPGVAEVEVQSSDVREVSVVVDPQKALAHRLSLVEVADRLRDTNDVTSVGRLDKDYSRFLLLASGQFSGLKDIRDTVVTVENKSPIRVSDIAQVEWGHEDPRMLVYGDGQPGALLSVSPQIGGNIVEIAREVKDLAAHLGTVIPATLRLPVVYDMADFVREAVASVRDAVIVGGVLAVFVLFVFLREARSTLIAAVSLPTTVISTFFFVRIFGGTLNLMSLGGLAIAIGLVIDDAVVIIENIYRHLGLGESPSEAAEKGTQELIGPVVGSTATTVVVFTPLSLLEGYVGDFFKALCLTLVVAVLISLLFALTLIPLLSERFLSQELHREASSRFMEPVYRGYERAVRWSLQKRWLVAGATAFSLILAGFLYTRLETGFLPDMDEGGFVLDNWTPPGTSLAQTNAIDRKIEELIRQTPEAASFLRRTGAEMGPFVTEQNKGEIIVRLKPRAHRKRGIEEVMEDLRQQILTNIPGVHVEFTQVLQDMINDMESVPEPVEVKIFGSDIHVLERLADEAGPKIASVKGIADFKGLQRGNPEILIHVDPVPAGRLGLSVDQVSQQVSAGLLGLAETDLREADRTVRIRVRFPDSFRYNYENVRQFPIVTPAKEILPLSALSQVDRVQGQNELLRENQRLMVDLTATLENRDLGGVVSDVRRALDEIRFPVGTYYEIGGQYESQQKSFRDLLSVLSLALIAVFIVLVVQFRAFAPALIILSAAPLSLLGVFGMLSMTQLSEALGWGKAVSLNVSSYMGVILMVGLVVKNGIILFEYVHKLWEEEGMPLGEALVAAGKIRVRPILMTTLCTLFGLLPLALGLGAGAELQKPLALAVMGGLSISTFITLLVMPVLYSLLERR